MAQLKKKKKKKFRTAFQNPLNHPKAHGSV
jgi:hypothetical protein